MTEVRIPFKVMKTTLNLLRAATLMVVATLKAENLNSDQLALVRAIVVANDVTTKRLKTNPTRRQLLTLCGAWRRFADQSQGLIADEQAELRAKMAAAVEQAAWVKELEPIQLSEVKP